MKKDLGMLVFGVVLVALGLFACFKGNKGESINIWSDYFDASPTNTSSNGAISVGLLMIAGGSIFIYQSGYLRGKK